MNFFLKKRKSFKFSSEVLLLKRRLRTLLQAPKNNFDLERNSYHKFLTKFGVNKKKSFFAPFFKAWKLPLLSVVTLLFSVSNLGFLAFLKKKGFCSHSEKSVSKTFWHKDVWQLHVEGKKKKKRNEFAEKRKSSQNLIY